MFLLLTYLRIYTFLWCKDTPFLFVLFSNKEFEGNTDQFLVVRHLLKNPINVTRYIRIYPVAWNKRISLRADFYGCKSVEIPETVCASPLGMENGKIPDSAIVASSRYSYSSDYYGPERGRLNNPGGWMSDHSNEHQFLQIDLENVTKVTRIATQGLIDNGWGRWTKTYTLDYSEDGGTFISYHTSQVLEGNTDSVHTEGRSLDPPIVARFIKINVKTYQGYPSLRVELYGCSDGFPTPKPLVCLKALGMQNKQIPDSAITASSYLYWHSFPTSKPPACMASLGLENNNIPDSAIKASSERYYKASRSRLYQQESWIAAINGAEQWFQVEFVNWTKVTGVAIQGCSYRSWQRWVTKFKLAYSYDGEFFRDYREDGDYTKVLLYYGFRAVHFRCTFAQSSLCRTLD
ncbi:venom prothrombin activator omicarin-C non-catalytic subunit-like [Orbicella faveolata]|uniref:venom prothrombin activator omicarin-C non-catalytic subunit-like n=1 Tax=Orbicella faveolata TaxID=48498 RepID=UPI0009E61FD7|nr:venom prothrombin activator omicarin-C non-catalytic subunit-like [Orbicella faveolata]